MYLQSFEKREYTFFLVKQDVQEKPLSVSWALSEESSVLSHEAAPFTRTPLSSLFSGKREIQSLRNKNNVCFHIFMLDMFPCWKFLLLWLLLEYLFFSLASSSGLGTTCSFSVRIISMRQDGFKDASWMLSDETTYT